MRLDCLTDRFQSDYETSYMKTFRLFCYLFAAALSVCFAMSPASLAVALQNQPSEPGAAQAQAAALDPAAPADLRPKWTVGQTARYSFWNRTQKQETAQVLGRVQSETTTYLSEGEVGWKVDAINADGSTTCTMTLRSIKFTITAGENDPVVIDSANPTADQQVFNDLVIAMTTTPLIVTVAADGSIASVTGIEAMKTAAGAQAVEADLVPEERDFVETASELATLVAAPAQATPGQTWTTQHTWNHDAVIPGTDTIGDWDTTYTYNQAALIAGVPIATIKTQSDIDLKVDLSKLPEQSPDIDVQIQDAKGKGEILFDLSRNETVARNDSMAYSADITISPPNPQMPPIKIAVKQSSQSQLLRIAEGQAE